MDIVAIADLAPVIPVLTVERVADAVPLARALVRGGLPVLEITLRTPVALEGLAAIAAEVEGAVVGAGTVLEVGQVDKIVAAGARFAVSPGFSPAVGAAVRGAGLPFLPGIQTVSESLAAAEQGGSGPTTPWTTWPCRTSSASAARGSRPGKRLRPRTGCRSSGWRPQPPP